MRLSFTSPRIPALSQVRGSFEKPNLIGCNLCLVLEGYLQRKRSGFRSQSEDVLVRRPLAVHALAPFWSGRHRCSHYGTDLARGGPGLTLAIRTLAPFWPGAEAMQQGERGRAHAPSASPPRRGRTPAPRRQPHPRRSAQQHADLPSARPSTGPNTVREQTQIHGCKLGRNRGTQWL